jgi:WhiB family transcriptional regulator, redox-sensing transcriptional regulator
MSRTIDSRARRRAMAEAATGAEPMLVGSGGDGEIVDPVDVAENQCAEVYRIYPLHNGVDEDRGWQSRALCAQTDPESFFPEKGGSTREAKKICLNCEVKVDCLSYALANDERFGIWGGLSERERRRLKRAAG